MVTRNEDDRGGGLRAEETARTTTGSDTRRVFLSRVVMFQFAIAVLTIIISALVGFQILPLIKRKEQLEADVRAKNDELTRLQSQIDKTNEDLKEAMPLANLSADDVTRLRDLLPAIQTKREEGVSLAELNEQSKLASDELERIKSVSSEKQHRATIKIRYYVKKDQDGESVESALKFLQNYGFLEKNFERSDKRYNSPTNAVGLVAGGMTAEDVRIVALALIRFGVRVKYIGRPTDLGFLQSLTHDGPRMHLANEPEVDHDPPLGVERIRDMSLEQMWAGTKKLTPTAHPNQ